MENWKLKQRELVSFDGDCPLNCKHCYTYQLDKIKKPRTINEIVESISNSTFDVIYVSQKKENFIHPQDGVKLCKALYERYKKDIFIITRIALTDNIINELKQLSEVMKKTDNLLYIALSIPALESYNITENIEKIATPVERIDCLKRAKRMGLHTILMARPLYPSSIVPLQEVIELIAHCKDFVECVVASGVAVNEKILEQLQMQNEKFSYLENDMSNYLVGAIPCKLNYVNVMSEMKGIKEFCDRNCIKFFDHSMYALNYIKDKATLI